MKLLIIATLVAVAAVVSADEEIPIVRQENEVKEDGSYKFGFEAGNGIVHDESGQGGVFAEGQYSYTNEEGQTFKVTYRADENGFKPEGDHIHPIPDLIVKALKQTGVLRRRRR